MNDIHKTSAIVKAILEAKTETRNSDELLYREVLAVHGFEMDKDILSMSVGYFLRNMNLYNCPKFETVRRSRQKIQATYPELRPCKAVEDGRMQNEQLFRGFAKESLNG